MNRSGGILKFVMALCVVIISRCGVELTQQPLCSVII